MVLRERVESKVDVSEITAAEAHHWPIVRSFMDRIDLVKIVNQLVPTQMAVEPGLIVKGLVIDTLSGRSPLYHLESSFEHADRELLFGEDVPASYFNDDNVARTLDQLYAVGTNAWETLGPLAQSTPTKNRPLAIYRAHESTVTLYDKRYRAVVIHSSSHDKRRNKKLDRDIQSSEKVLLQQDKERAKPVYACRADADAAAKAAGQEKTRYHRLEVSVQKHLQYAKGRPKKELPRTPIGGHYQLTLRVVENTKAIEIGRQVAGCFVMLTNIPVDGKQGYDSTKILRTYKDQQGVERNFSFLKDDQIVNALFLKRRDRIEVLGLILLMALLIWRLMEHQMRGHLQHHETTVPGWDNKPTQRPTAYMLTIKFKGILILRVGHQRTLAQPLSETQNAFLKALELPSTVFIQPPDTR